ncbi:protein PBDC1 isoform X1 [Homalodisca vitripennis]|uniref:protein PBDC1 isoform X1 n=2 Tax=Homalodisca vitripennis TaxID=197043 RepID=UPI001EEA5B0C|nr:protein PBDC1 isoform X1 [Homalodisca vitripennis]
MNGEGMLAGASVLSRPAEEFENDPTVEAMWAIKAYEHAEIYFNILCSVDPRLLRLTPNDDAIYKAFRDEFPNMDVKVLNEDEMKSAEGKEKWRPFCEKFKNCVEDYSFGTLIRLDSDGEYTEANSILTTRIQFFAVELARNREGYNDGIRTKYKPGKTEQKS